MNKSFFFITTVYLFLIFSICVLNTQAQSIDTLKSEQVFLMLTSCKFNKTIIDGRDSTMFYSGHIKNAVYIDAFSENVIKTLEKYITKDTLIVYCTNQTRSKTIIENLKSLNYEGQIIYMQDGLTGWKKNKYEIEIPLNNN